MTPTNAPPVETPDGRDRAALQADETSAADHSSVIVNGRERQVDHRCLTFDEVVRLAFDPVPSGPNVVLTVSFRHADDERKGTLIEGQSVEVKEHGTVFNVTATDKS